MARVLIVQVLDQLGNNLGVSVRLESVASLCEEHLNTSGPGLL